MTVLSRFGLLQIKNILSFYRDTTNYTLPEVATTEDTTVFHPIRALSAEQLHNLLHQIIKRVMKFLTHRGDLIREQGMVYLTESDTHTAMEPLQSTACIYCTAFGSRAGQKVLSLQSAPSFDVQHTQKLCVSEQGFSLHAEVRCAMNQRKKLEQSPLQFMQRRPL